MKTNVSTQQCKRRRYCGNGEAIDEREFSSERDSCSLEREEIGRNSCVRELVEFGRVL
jgi:hypothetical protein